MPAGCVCAALQLSYLCATLNPANVFPIMMYEIKISGDANDNGTIELHRLALLAQSVKDIANAALRIRLVGISTEKGRVSEQVLNAGAIHLAAFRQGSVVLGLECDTFKKSLEGYAGDLFNPGVLDELPAQTPMTLVIEAFRMAGSGAGDSRYLDKGLLRKLKSFEKIFESEQEVITFSNQGSIPVLELRKADFSGIRQLEERIPQPREVIVYGTVDEMKFSKSSIKIDTQDGTVTGILSETLGPDAIAKYWGKPVTIEGEAHFADGGKLVYIYIRNIFDPAAPDKYFSKVPHSETIAQQILKHQQSPGINRLRDIIGKWPDDEEDVNDMLNDID